MAATPDPRPEPGADAGVEAPEDDIDRTRAELGETVGALADKLDVKARAHAKVEDTKHAVVQRRDEFTQGVKAHPAVPVGAVVTATVVLIGFLWWRRRR
ncbi:DUF3618 domain-containing protein [Mycolicibacterium sp.]|uniref:DUF3618 domain-containing protein n=1 Tax=Mycolicibacterium sp. TaxID=2320850 RepID=UPI003D09CAAF